MITPEQIKEKGFTEDQANFLMETSNNFIAIKTKEIEDKYSSTANENAEKILHGAAVKVTKDTGVERMTGEKIGDFILRVHNENLKSVTGLKTDYEEKIKNIKGSETLSQEFTELKNKYSKIQEKEATFDELLNSGLKDKFEKVSNDYETLKLQSAFGEVKPVKPENVNLYEFDAKWNGFKSKVLAENNIEIIDGIAVAISKENVHKRVKLVDLLTKDVDLQELIKTRDPKGVGSATAKGINIEGVPFEVPKGADSKTRSELITAYLNSLNIHILSKEYSKLFTELNSKILASS